MADTYCDDDSPEELYQSEPVLDLYPSDDEVIKKGPPVKKLKASSKANYNQNTGSVNRYKLHKLQDASEMCAEQVQHLLHVDFVPREKEICLKQASMEECLYQVLQFTSNVTNNSITNLEEFKLNGKTVTEIYANLAKTVPCYSWIMENDKSNFHSLTHEEYQQELKFFCEHAGNWRNKDNKFYYSHFMKSLLGLFDAVYIDNNVDEKSLLVKEYLEVVADFLSNSNFRRNERCRKEVKLVVQNLDPTDNKGLSEDQQCTVIVQPDGVVVGAPSNHHIRMQGEAVWMHLIQVYDDVRRPETLIPPHSPSSTQPNIVNPQNRNKIHASIPTQCSSSHCMDKIAGQHVLQLFAMAEESLLCNESKNLFSSEHSTKCAKATGFFIVDEFVYFSKLLVEDFWVWYITRGVVTAKDMQKLIRSDEVKPRVAYGNFRLDLTIANHRKAFILFFIHRIAND